MTARGRVEGKVALVTGAAGGIGGAIVRRLAAEGASVVATDLHDSAELPDDERVRFLRHDVSDERSWNEVVTATEATFGPLSVLVNNAGVITWSVPFDELTEADYRRVIDVNQVGVFLGMKAAAASLERSGAGSIVNLSSTAGLTGFPGLMAYVASKWAVRGMSKAAALELGPRGVRVNSVHPGRTATPMTAGRPEPMDQPITGAAAPEELAAMVLFLASDESRYCTGGEYVMDGGMTAGKMPAAGSAPAPVS